MLSKTYDENEKGIALHRPRRRKWAGADVSPMEQKKCSLFAYHLNRLSSCELSGRANYRKDCGRLLMRRWISGANRLSARLQSTSQDPVAPRIHSSRQGTAAQGTPALHRGPSPALPASWMRV